MTSVHEQAKDLEKVINTKKQVQDILSFYLDVVLSLLSTSPARLFSLYYIMFFFVSVYAHRWPGGIQSDVLSPTPASTIHFCSLLRLAFGYHGGDIGCGFWR